MEQASQHKHSIQPSINAFRQPSKCTPKGAGQGGVLPVELTQRMEERRGEEGRGRESPYGPSNEGRVTRQAGQPALSEGLSLPTGAWLWRRTGVSKPPK